jgi:hypothetical protein
MDGRAETYIQTFRGQHRNPKKWKLPMVVQSTGPSTLCRKATISITGDLRRLPDWDEPAPGTLE